jgi:hypothetical protein
VVGISRLNAKVGKSVGAAEAMMQRELVELIWSFQGVAH